MDLFKVFICEDESIVREGLRDMIPWEKYGFEFVGFGNNLFLQRATALPRDR